MKITTPDIIDHLKLMSSTEISSLESLFKALQSKYAVLNIVNTVDVPALPGLPTLVIPKLPPPPSLKGISPTMLLEILIDLSPSILADMAEQTNLVFLKTMSADQNLPKLYIANASKSMAQKELELAKELKRKYGVAFNSKMDLKTISSQWKKALLKNPQLLSKNPEVAVLISAVDVAIQANDIVVKAHEIQAKIVTATKMAQNAVGAANPITSAQFTPIVTQEAIALGMKLAMELQNKALQVLEGEVLSVLNKLPVPNPYEQ